MQWNTCHDQLNVVCLWVVLNYFIFGRNAVLDAVVGIRDVFVCECVETMRNLQCLHKDWLLCHECVTFYTLAFTIVFLYVYIFFRHDSHTHLSCLKHFHYTPIPIGKVQSQVLITVVETWQIWWDPVLCVFCYCWQAFTLKNCNWSHFYQCTVSNPYHYSLCSCGM